MFSFDVYYEDRLGAMWRFALTVSLTRLRLKNGAVPSGMAHFSCILTFLFSLQALRNDGADLGSDLDSVFTQCLPRCSQCSPPGEAVDVRHRSWREFGRT